MLRNLLVNAKPRQLPITLLSSIHRTFTARSGKVSLEKLKSALDLAKKKIKRVEAEKKAVEEKVGRVEAEKKAVEEKVGRVEAEKKAEEEKVGRVEAESKVVKVQADWKVSEVESRLSETLVDVLRLKGVLSVRGMLDYIESQHKEKFCAIIFPKKIDYSRRGLYIYLAKQNPTLINVMKPPITAEKFGKLMVKIYDNYSKDIHDVRSAEEVSDARDAILIRESQRIDYEQVQCIVSLAKAFNYPYEVKLTSRHLAGDSVYHSEELMV